MFAWFNETTPQPKVQVITLRAVMLVQRFANSINQCVVWLFKRYDLFKKSDRILLVVFVDQITVVTKLVNCHECLARDLFTLIIEHLYEVGWLLVIFSHRAD